MSRTGWVVVSVHVDDIDDLPEVIYGPTMEEHCLGFLKMMQASNKQYIYSIKKGKVVWTV